MRRLAVFLILAVLSALAPPLWAGVTLQPGDILVADAIAMSVVLIEPDAVGPDGQARQTLIFNGLDVPRSVAVDAQGNIEVTSEGSGTVSVIDPATGSRVRTYDAPLIEKPYGLSLSAPGQALRIYITVGGTGQIAGIDPASGVAQPVCPSVSLQAPRGLAATAGSLLIADYGTAPGNQPPRDPQPGGVDNRSRIVQVNLADCSPSTLSCPSLQRATGVALQSEGSFYVSDETGRQILQVDANGACQTVSKQPQYLGPREIALQADGSVVMADFVAGAVFVVNPQGGAIQRTFSGGLLRGPNGVFVVGGTPSPPPPASGSSFQVAGGIYVWKITAQDLQADDTALLLSALMNRLVFRLNPQQQQAKDLVLTLPPSMPAILKFTATGVVLQGTLDAAHKLVLSSITALGS